MKALSIVLTGALALAAFAAPGPSPAQAPAPQAAPPAKAGPETAAPEEVEPEAKAALQKMSAYLGTLDTFEIKATTSLDLVTQTGQRVQLNGDARYRVRRPNGFVIDVNTDWKKRTFIYDGKSFTVFAPEKGYYATVPAPGTILATLDLMYEKFGIALPVEDLFRWNNEGSRRVAQIDSGWRVGTVTISGTKTDHYAFRQDDIDWQVWIEQGDRPLPRRLVIIDRSQAEQPAYQATFDWTLNPRLADDTFAFKAGPNAKAIQLTVLSDGGSQ
ncbi:DUF2092 domain-containing protein [Phenylobacterium sp. J367]|uniref:DUF2092 domain-containing protein n=1 Tax=Phenylobacterium sp. J367 TaxID=2898435 RepID=UPI002150BFCF|nr:DUF2092 domain-containing protein [Phenylobacterium sp. J367]MCR5878824.1 DUF2092 domain-containing protein [Phenylobacterium sp. J367]